MTQYKVGKVVEGIITGVEKYGIFVSLDNFYSGLIHISEISNDFVRNTNDYGMVGETIFVKILEIDEETNHAKLSIKDIDHRIGKTKRRSKIKETGTGFKILEDNLDLWIKEKLNEISR